MGKFVIVYVNQEQRIVSTISNTVHRDAAELARNIPVSEFPLLAIDINVETGEVKAVSIESRVLTRLVYPESKVVAKV